MFAHIQILKLELIVLVHIWTYEYSKQLRIQKNEAYSGSLNLLVSNI